GYEPEHKGGLDAITSPGTLCPWGPASHAPRPRSGGRTRVRATRRLHAAANEHAQYLAILRSAAANQSAITTFQFLAGPAASRPASTVKRLAEQCLHGPVERSAAGQCGAIAAQCLAAKRPGVATLRPIDGWATASHAAAANLADQGFTLDPE